MRPALLFAARVLPVALSLAGCHPSGGTDYTGFIGCGTVIPSKVQVSGMGNRGAWTLPGGHILPAYYSAYDASQCERMGLQGRDARDCGLSDVDTPFEINKPGVSD